MQSLQNMPDMCSDIKVVFFPKLKTLIKLMHKVWHLLSTEKIK